MEGNFRLGNKVADRGPSSAEGAERGDRIGYSRIGEGGSVGALVLALALVACLSVCVEPRCGLEVIVLAVETVSGWVVGARMRGLAGNVIGGENVDGR